MTGKAERTSLEYIIIVYMKDDGRKEGGKMDPGIYRNKSPGERKSFSVAYNVVEQYNNQRAGDITDNPYDSPGKGVGSVDVQLEIKNVLENQAADDRDDKQDHPSVFFLNIRINQYSKRQAD